MHCASDRHPRRAQHRIAWACMQQLLVASNPTCHRRVVACDRRIFLAPVKRILRPHVMTRIWTSAVSWCHQSDHFQVPLPATCLAQTTPPHHTSCRNGAPTWAAPISLWNCSRMSTSLFIICCWMAPRLSMLLKLDSSSNAPSALRSLRKLVSISSRCGAGGRVGG